MSYAEHIAKPTSEKQILCWIEPAERLLEWELHSGQIYKRDSEYFVISIKEEGDTATERDSLGGITGAGEWFFDGSTKILYYRSFSDQDPSIDYTVGFYRIPFSNRPFIGPIRDGGRDVSYNTSFSRSPQFKHKLDHEDQLGVALTSNSSMQFILDDFFLENYDRLVWKNKRVIVYSHSPDLDFSEKQLYFDGRIDDKSYSGTTVTFKVKDFLDKLRSHVPLDLYDDNENLPDSRIGRAKRRIYGRVKGLKAISLNQIKDGYLATGTASGAVDDTTISISGGNANRELRPGDKLSFGDNNYTVKNINSNTSIVLTEGLKEALDSADLFVSPEIQTSRLGKNTEFQICNGHALKALSTTVVSQISKNKFKLTSTDGVLADDIITIGGEIRTVRRVVTGNIIVLTQNVVTNKTSGDPVTKNPVQKVFENGLRLVPERDYTLSNLTSGAILTVDESAEFNVTTAEALQGTLTFTNGSEFVGVSGIELKGNFGLRDWVAPDSLSFNTFYEILEIDEDNSRLKLASDFSGTYSGDSLIKRPLFIGDKTDLTVECFGKSEDGTATGVFIETGAQIVKDLLDEAGVDNLNLASFDLAKETAPQTMSLPIPINIDDKSPTLKEVIKLVNLSIFGSLHYNNDFEIEYNILTSEKPNNILNEPLTDSDVLGWTVSSTGKNIIRKCIGNYQFQDSDRFTGEKAFAVVSYDNEYAQRVIEASREEVFDFYLWDASAAQIMVERKCYMNESAQSILEVSGKLNLAKYSINDKILVSFDRLYGRIGSLTNDDNRKVMIVSGISKANADVRLTLDDLGNIWNRTAAITDDTAVEWTLSTNEKIINGYITDSNGLIDDVKETFKINLIG